MPQGKGTYGSKVGRPPKNKKIDPKKGSNKKKPARKKKEQTGYGPQNRPGTFAKKRVVRGSAKKKLQKQAPTGNQGMKRKTKKKPVNTPSAPAGYSKRTRMDMAAKKALSGGVAKKKKKAGQKGYMKDVAAIAKGDKKKDNGGVKKGKVKKGKVYTKPQGPRHLALKKRADARDKKSKKKKPMSVAQLRKAGKINF